MPLSPIDRKVGLLRQGVTMSEIGRGLGVTPNHVSKVVAGERRSPAVEQAVAQALGLPAEEVFGDATAVA